MVQHILAGPRRLAIRGAGGGGGGLYRAGGKRALDVVLVLAALPVVAPLVALLWLLARADGGPGLVGHRRVGRSGRAFRCWKIRSMVPDAERRLRAHLAADAAARREWAARCKLARDPRITGLGRWLRRSSLDELPQLWNVLVGEMSLVGPRPVTAPELARYGGRARSYLSTRPGLTGAWQVSGRNDLDYAERIRLDALYGATHDLQGDLRILCLTLRAVISARGL